MSASVTWVVMQEPRGGGWWQCIAELTSFISQLICIFIFYIQSTEKQKNRETGKLVRKYGMIDFGENIIIIWILEKSGSVAPAKLEIKSVSPYIKSFWIGLRNIL